VEGADLGPDWIKQLQAWWDRHAFYPGEAVMNNVSGTVIVHIVVRPDGEVTTVHVEEGSGSKFLNNAAYLAFSDAHLHPFPPVPKADVYITLHYVLTHGQVTAATAVSKRPFTVTDKPVQATNASSLQQKTCTGVLVLDSPNGEIDSWYGRHDWARAIFYRTPDGKPRVKFWTSWGSNDVAVNEFDGSAGWLGQLQRKGQTHVQLRFSLWPAGADHVGGSVVDIYKGTLDGAIDLTCASEPAEQAGR
jgi:TonB family protein